jgi:hypothetical protein
MSLGRFRKGEKLTPEAKAEQIKAKFAAKMTKNGSLFTPGQEDLMLELGLKNTGEEVANAQPSKKAAPLGKKPKKRDPLTKRQRRLMAELGLTSQIPEPETDED